MNYMTNYIINIQLGIALSSLFDKNTLTYRSSWCIIKYEEIADDGCPLNSKR